MRLLFLLQGQCVEDQPGYDDGFRRLLSDSILEDYQVIPYYAYIKQYGYDGFYRHAFDAAKKMEADYIFLQFPHGLKVSPVDFIKRVRNLASKPTIFTSNGDPFGTFLHPAPHSLLAAARHSDITFTTALGRLAQQFKRHGARNIVLMPHGYCQVRFGKCGLQITNEKEFDIVFVGSLTNARNPFKYYYWAMRHRKEMIDTLCKRYGTRFAIYGHGWQGNSSWQGPIPFKEQELVYQRARIVFGGYPGATTDYYNSDRPFISAVSGTPLVDYNVPRVDRFLENGKHWFLFNNQREMVSIFDNLLAKDEITLGNIGNSARELCLNRHSQYHRCKLMIEIVSQVRKAQLAGKKSPLPKLDFFHDKVQLEDEYPTAICNWK